MDSEPGSGSSGGRPRRGRPARIGRAQIVAAARAIPAGELTMKAVADALGVDRKALHRHVGDRGGLLDLVVADHFESELRRIELPADAEWPDALRTYGKALRDGVEKMGGIKEHFRLSGGAESLMLPWAERVLQALVRGGFAVPEAGSILNLVAKVSISAAYEAESHVHPHLPEVARVLGNRTDTDFPVLTEIVALRAAASPAVDDFQFDLDVIIAGLERRLSE
ncbi:hypothetical protein A5740_27280 [Mycobacterium sp. GA-1841]|uniref:TetR/AcrR family transcriptional regulator C-terminal domain-containing protein n=1 Tax=Mycobacterium sp. GA-1841 TaxID=1834154 RepID=UPI00096DCA69|nr:TetR/AcrR family transcriptional regulator C-terminal domain-containing protein [Mycobacterium sp. GA-1841]OMC38327.1 hypothetical protein A5740_27280 [Mycobacterium sp. GA-1841]